MPTRVTQKTISTFLARYPLGTIATSNKNGRTDLAVVYFVVNPDLSCDIVTKSNTRKYRNALQGSSAIMMVFCEDKLTSVELSGGLEPIEDTLQIVAITERFEQMAEEHRPGYWIPPIAQLNVGKYVVLRLFPKKILYRRYALSKRDHDTVTEVVINIRR